MSNAIRDFFEQAYANSDRYWWRQPQIYSMSPDDHAGSLITQSVLRYAEQHGPGRAIDVGSGEGADAIRLAKLGWEVDAIELTEAGVAKIRRFAELAEVKIGVHRGDLLTQDLPASTYDLVICNGVMHYIEDKAEACRRLQEMTAVGGANAISLWSDYTPVPDCHQVVPTYPDHERGAIEQAYSTWHKSLFYFERMRAEMGHDDMPSHLHSFIKVVAFKPAE